MKKNIILGADSYKVGSHFRMYPPGTQFVYSYFECRPGAKYDDITWFGLQYIIKNHLAGKVVTADKINEAAMYCRKHFGSEYHFNRAGWEYILKHHNGLLPIEIRALDEGTRIKPGVVPMTIVNTDAECYWLTNYVETILSQVWYPTTVATISGNVRKMITNFMLLTSENGSVGVEFKLHDFGFRGVSSHESAEIGGCAHLVHFRGTDTIAAMRFAHEYYDASLDDLAFSVPASEHSIMSSRGAEGEAEIVENLLRTYQLEILSIVADTYDIYNFVENLVCNRFKDRILNRQGTFVIRPDSVTPTHKTPEDQMLWIVETLWKSYGGETNSKGYKVLHPKVRVLWGDGIDIDGIHRILDKLARNGWSTDNIATFGMGGGLLQKCNRDTLRCAFKSSAQMYGDKWHNVSKNPLDASKASKKGMFRVFRDENMELVTESTLNPHDLTEKPNMLKLVFRDGNMFNHQNFADIRDHALVDYCPAKEPMNADAS